MERIMVPIQAHRSAGVQGGIASQLDAGASLADALVEGAHQVADLHLGLGRVTLEQANLAARQLMSAEDARQFLKLADAQVQPSAARTFDYGYYLTRIAAQTHSDLIQAMGDSITEINRMWIECAANDVGSFPAMLDAAYALFREFMESASRIYAAAVRTNIASQS
ncbi:hypothetical protein EGT07_22350 [Herbaspirillum sp. HC18]|nr:hypothetical protein EGT07_22350 [Herbaspirillum sp. HC18]